MRLFFSKTTSFSLNNYLTLKNALNVLLISIVVIEFYQPCSLFAEAGRKSKKYVVVKEVGTTYKKVPVYKKVPMKVLKVVIKKKKTEKPWKKWFKKEVIVKIPKEKKYHHHHAASEGHQTWALPALISMPRSMSEIFDAWPNDYCNNHSDQTDNNKHQQQRQMQASGMTPNSISDLKSIGSKEYPAFLAAAAAQLVHRLAYPVREQLQSDHQLAGQQQVEPAPANLSSGGAPSLLLGPAGSPTVGPVASPPAPVAYNAKRSTGETEAIKRDSEIWIER